MHRKAKPAEPSFQYPAAGVQQTIKELPVRLQPREVCNRMGVENCTEDILMAILLRSGAHGLNVLDLARRLLSEFGSLTALSRASEAQLAAYHGMGKVKAQVVKAAFALAARLAEEEQGDIPAIREPADAAACLDAVALQRETEAFWILVLDTKNRLMRGAVCVSEGLMNASLVHPREVFKEAIRMSAAGIILVHNHPSGDPTPSAEDLAITRQMIKAGQVVDTAVLDHIILGRKQLADGGRFVSIREQGLISFERTD